MLYLVGTPIGNMGDISSRAVEVLGSADIIACEDTRRTGLLLQSLGITGKLFSYHEHNKAAKGPVLIGKMREGAVVCLVSDAGMPSISDPGEDLVKLCIAEGIEVSAVPGPVACITALVLSGLDTRHYHFEGFLPSENSPRKKRLEALKAIDETIIIYEAPHRLCRLIDELTAAGFGKSRAAFCRELTKKYEQVLRMTVEEAREYYAITPPKGEFVICLEPVTIAGDDKKYSEDDIDNMAKDLINSGLSTKEASSKIAEITGLNRKELYDRIVKSHLKSRD